MLKKSCNFAKSTLKFMNDLFLFQLAIPALEDLVDKYLGHLYITPDATTAHDLQHIRSILIGQARDVLVSSNYRGDLSSFENVFLREASKIATSCRNACLHGNKVSDFIMYSYTLIYIRCSKHFHTHKFCRDFLKILVSNMNMRTQYWKLSQFSDA